MNRLSQYLKSNQIRQAEFAGRCGVTQPVVSRLINETAQPSPVLAKRIEQETGGAVKFYDWPAFSHFAPQGEVGA